MALLSSFGYGRRNGSGGGGGSSISTESWTDFHKKHRSRPTYVGSSANKRKATLSKGKRSSSMGGAGVAGSSAIYGGTGVPSSSGGGYNRRGSMSNTGNGGNGTRRNSMY